MFNIQNKSGPNGDSETFFETGNIGDDIKNSKSKTIILEANSVNILSVLKNYNLPIDEYNKKIKCPFPFHTVDKSPSFYYYKDTNSFYCFGCKSGGAAVDFISLMENINKYEAANKLLNNFEPNLNIIKNNQDFREKQLLMLDFCKLVRIFLQNNLDDPNAICYSEKITIIFDTINTKHNLDVAGLKSLISKLDKKIKQYKY